MIQRWQAEVDGKPTMPPNIKGLSDFIIRLFSSHLAVKMLAPKALSFLDEQNNDAEEANIQAAKHRKNEKEKQIQELKRTKGKISDYKIFEKYFLLLL